MIPVTFPVLPEHKGSAASYYYFIALKTGSQPVFYCQKGSYFKTGQNGINMPFFPYLCRP